LNGNSSVIFNDNVANNNGGAVSCESSHIIFNHNSGVTFKDNEAITFGGASVVTFNKSSSLVFINNRATVSGGAIYSNQHCSILFNGSISVKFFSNSATNGGALYLASQSTAVFRGNSTTSFKDNRATLNGGAMYSFNNCSVKFDEYSDTIMYNNNGIFYGGGVFLNKEVSITFAGQSQITFYDNTATSGGGAMFISDYSTATFTENSKVNYFNNTVTHSGGAVHCDSQSTISLDENSTIIIEKNSANLGGAFYGSYSSIHFKGNASVTFTENSAENGGAVCTVQSSLTFTDNSSTAFINNSVTESGGAIHISDNFTAMFQDISHITFYHNIANRYGGAIYAEFTHSSQSTITFKTTEVKYLDNKALRGSKVYADMPTSCDDICLQNSIVGPNSKSFINGSLRSNINTPPKKLELYKPATCIENDTNGKCQMYLTRNTMLGQEIVIDACVRDYYDQPADGTLFILNNEGEDHQINSHFALVSCEGFRGIRIIGKEVTDAVNCSITLTSHDGSKSDLKTISLKLITELSPCHLGFHYNNDTKMCACYGNSDNIVSCSSNTSSIKRGYWFGKVNDNITVTKCPNNYCNFTCCETTNGYYQLSPARTNQCNLQRHGPACGSCKEGYTLSFDSVECVNVSKCTPGQTVLIIISSMTYWIILVTLVFIITYYYAGIGYWYAITYYYSVVDILLSNTLYTTQGLFTTVSVISSVAKVRPQFLGQLCLVQNMSGIDQQFIHYVHPLAVTIIVSIICLSARISFKISAFVSRGIIHVICFLLLLSYTSVATISLLLLRSLSFYNVDKVYTYLSPDIEYFHGRHLPYFITAILCALMIVIGLPLLLLLEPFINHKINFTRIKPLLDQFQGCYKDRYRSFAAYYMICRLVIIVIVISNSSNDNTTQYLLVTINATLSLIHVTIRPYASSLLNVFDGFILHLMIVMSMLPLADSFNQDLLLSFIFTLVLLPIGAFLIMEIHFYRRKIKEAAKNCIPPKPETTDSNNETAMSNLDFVDSIIDDDSRRNAYICEV